jgi:hypothetical protein
MARGTMIPVGLPLVSFVYELIVAIHLLGMAAIVGAFFAVLRAPRHVFSRRAAFLDHEKGVSDGAGR